MSAMVTAQEATTMVRSDNGFRHEMEPHTLEQMFKIAAGFAKIQLCGVTSGEEAMARMIAGRELGLSTMLSMMSVYVVKGMPSLSAKLKHSLCLSRPDICEEFRLLESSNEKATFRAKRRGQPEQDFTFTIEDAKRAGYIDAKKPDSAWNCHPRRMLEARAKGHAADAVFPDVLNGLATLEEMQDARIGVVQVTQQTADTGGPSGVIVDTTISQAPRDFDAELSRVKEDIMNARTKEERSDVRKRVAAFAADAGEPWGGTARDFYNEHCAKAKVANGTASPAAPPPVAPAPPSAPENEDAELP